jgi:hypothetical protein
MNQLHPAQSLAQLPAIHAAEIMDRDASDLLPSCGVRKEAAKYYDGHHLS